uniref:Cullin family profile domain-containing protein n=1 Tax=Meloidogyne incognita TaxID=6306 RepID=A0A914MDF1_MELIC
MWKDRGKNVISSIKKLIDNYDIYSREAFSIALEKLIRDKLLHVGVNTHDILQAYATIIECLSQYDPSFVLVHRICRIIRDYVKQRPDTMRTIITFIAIEKPGDNCLTSDIAVTNASRLTLMLEEEQLNGLNDEYVIMMCDNRENRWMDWIPDPIDADPKESRLFRESADVFNMLVSIYGSKDLFVKEYQNLLAERLLSNGWERHIHSEFTYLETMKRRFTEGELNQCEVMIRDIRDSWKLARFAASSLPFPVSPRIVSFVYWPEIQSSDLDSNFPFHPHSIFKDALDNYEKVYSQHKAARSITWHSDFGSLVELELEIDGKTLDIELPLPQAQILFLFAEKEKWIISELAEKSGINSTQLKKRLEWLCSKGLIFQGGLDEITLEETFCLTSSPSSIQIIEKRDEAVMLDDFSDDEEEEQNSVEDVVEELEQYWNYTKNLLIYRTTNEPLTAQYLHRMFKNFTSPGKTIPSLDAVQMFMHRKVRQNLVIIENGVYKATKDLK